MSINEVKELYCVHHHTREAHPHCFINGVGHPLWYKNAKIAFFDIETTGLDASFGTMLSWAIKPRDGKVVAMVTDREHILSKDEDKHLVNKFIEEMLKYDIVVGYYSCMDPEHTILMSDMTYKKLKNVKVGDEILSVKSRPNQYERRSFIKAKINFVQIIDRPMLQITLSDGTVLKVSREHPFLCPLGLANQANWDWRMAEDLKVGDTVTRMLPEWEHDTSYESGYLSAAVDGEGHISLGKGFRLGFSQKNNPMLHEFLNLIKKYGFDFKNYHYKDDVQKMTLNSASECCRFLGLFRPKRLLSLFSEKIEGKSAVIHLKNRTYVTKIEDIGIGKVVGLSTTSGTYISNGFVSHNSRFDMPFARTRAFTHNLEFPAYGATNHIDLYYVVRSKFKLSRNRLDNASRLCGVKGKTFLDPSIWRRAGQGDPKALKYVLVHNIKDVEILEKTYLRMENLFRGTRRSI